MKKQLILSALGLALLLQACGSQYSPLNPQLEPPPCVPPPALFRVNCGDLAYLNSGCGSGVSWAADQVYSSGSWGRFGGTNVGSGIPAGTAVPGTSDDPLFYKGAIGSPIEYRFDVPSGSYSVTLYFLEDFWGAPGNPGGAGSRIFSVQVEGVTLAASFDIFAVAGARTAYSLSTPAPVPVSDGTLNVVLTVVPPSVDGNATINAIEVK
jgi:hypothetical protein